MKTWHRTLAGLTLLLGMLSMLALQPALAANWSIYKNYSFDKLVLAQPKPFAKVHLVIMVTQDQPKRWRTALNNVKNVSKFFGQDNIQVVLVTYGPGLKMLFANSPFAKRINSLSVEGVEFDACHNTMLGFKRKTGHLPKLVSSAVVVPGGIVRIMQLEEHGYNFIKP